MEYGRGYSELVGRNHYEVLPDVPDEWKKIHQQCLAGATLKNEEDYWEQSDGSKNWLKWAVLPWHYPDGKIGGIIISAEDIKERIELFPNILILLTALRAGRCNHALQRTTMHYRVPQ